MVGSGHERDRLAGRIAGHVAVGNIASGASFSGDFSLAINNTR